MRSLILGLAAATLAAGVAVAQGTTQGTTGGAPSGGAAPPPPVSGTPAATSNGNAAAGDDNQAVATTNANAARPASGHNSFTRGEARRRIASEGFTHVTGLKVDGQGVWRGHAMRHGAPTAVWLDYKGNVGTASS